MSQIVVTNKKKVRQSHIIPDFYLRKFSSRGKLYVYTKGQPVRSVNVKPGGRVKECRERDYFEYPVDKDWTENKVENWLASIEDKASSIYPAIEDNKQLSSGDAEIWATFVASLFLRTQKVRLQLAPAALNKIRPVYEYEDIRDYQYRMFKQGRLIPYERLKEARDKVWDEMATNPAFGHLISLNHSTPTIAQSILKKAWTVCEACEGSHFITSDAPVITLKVLGDNRAFSGYGFGQIDVAIFVPISPTRVFIAGPANILWHKLQDTNNVALVNKAIANFAHKYVYSDSNLRETQELIEQELGLTKFGDNAFKLTTPKARPGRSTGL